MSNSITFSASAAAMPGTNRVITTDACCNQTTNVQPDVVTGLGYTWTLSTGATGTGSPLTTNFLSPGIYLCTFTAWATNQVCGVVSTNLVATGTVCKVDMVGHKPGKWSTLGDEVSESDEDDPISIILPVNDDNDDAGPLGQKDNRDTVIGSDDNEIVQLTLKQLDPSLEVGTLELTVSDPSAVRVFNKYGLAELVDYSVDLESPTGDLEDLASGDLDIYVEGLSANEDVTFTLTYKAPDGTEVCGDEVHIMVARIKIVKIWSDQLGNGSVCNYLPFGGGSYDYILLGGNATDHKAYAKAEIDVHPVSAISHVLVRLGEKVSGKFVPDGDGSLSGNIASMNQDAVTGDRFVVAGFDTDGSGNLDTEEVGSVAEGIPGDPYTIKVVDESMYNSDVNALYNYAASFLAVGLDTAAAHMVFFLDPVLPAGTTSIYRDEPQPRALEHPVGLDFNTSCYDTSASDLIWGSSSAISSKVRDSATLKDALLELFATPAVQQDVFDYFATPGSDDTHEFAWAILDKTLDYGNHNILDADAFGAFAKCELNCVVSVGVARSAGFGLFGPTVYSIHVNGQQLDLYDWDYGITFPHPDRYGAEVQAGYPTLGTAGHVFRTTVELDGDVNSAAVGYHF